MLVLSRKQLRSTTVEGSNDAYLVFKVMMVTLQGGGVRLGLEVNTDQPVHRCDVSDRSRANGPSGYPTESATRQTGAP